MKQAPITFFNCRGDRLSGILHYPRDGISGGAAVLCHGMDSTKNSAKLISLATSLAEAGVLALRFDFSYVGESSGCFADMTCSGELDDLSSAYALVESFRPEKIAVLGSSLGGTVGVLFAAKMELAALVTIAAPLHPVNVPRRLLTEADIAQWRERGFIHYNGRRLNLCLLEDLESLDLPAAARSVVCPTLVIHGDADLVVPVEEAHELHACLGGTKRLSILSGGDHRFSEPALMRRVLADSLAWLLKHLR